MSDELEKPEQPADDAVAADAAPEAQTSTDGDGLDKLMQPDGAASDARIESAAIEAARDAVRAAESAIDDYEVEVEANENGVERQAAVEAAKRRLWLLRGALILNFSLMGLMLAMPSQEAPHTTPSAAHHGDAEAGHLPPSPFVEPLRDPRYVIPRDKLYEEALLVARDGNYEDAAQLLQRYIESHPGLHPSLMHGTYVLMERYLRLAGRVEESIQYGNLARRLVGQTYLPEDLWNAARAAEELGDARSMREAYARLLLQRGMLTASQLAIVTEAYLKLGDSYRLEADQGDVSGVPPMRDEVDGQHGNGDPGHGDKGHGGH